jgi:hypothetical protein
VGGHVVGHLRRVAVLSFLCLLTVGASAFAECAWVLWQEEQLFTATPAETSWQLLQATPTYAACESGLAARIRDAETEPRQNVEITVQGPIITKTIRGADGRSASRVLTYRGLP